MPQQQIIKLKNKLFKKYNLSPVKQLGTSGHFDTIKCRGKNNKYYILKIRKNKTKTIQEKFLKEIYINKLLGKQKKINNSITFSKYLASSDKAYPEWLFYQYTEGLPMGGWYNFGDDELQKAYRQLPKIIETLAHISLPKNKLKKNRYREIYKNFNNYNKLLNKYFTSFEIQKGQEIINKNKKLLNSVKLILTHGDLHPGNIILTPDNKLSIVDWSDAQLNNYAFDAAFLWLELWNQDKIQKYFFKNLLRKAKDKQEFKKLFKVNIVRLTPKMLEIVDDGKNYFNKLKNEKNFSVQNKLDYEIIEKAIDYFISAYKKIV